MDDDGVWSFPASKRLLSQILLDQVISQLLHCVVGCTGLNAFWIVTEKKSKLSPDSDNAFTALSKNVSLPNPGGFESQSPERADGQL